MNTVIVNLTGSSAAGVVDVLSRGGYDSAVVADTDTMQAATGIAPTDVVILLATGAAARLLEVLNRLTSTASAPIVVVRDRIGAKDARFLIAAGARGLVIRADAAHALVPTVDAVVAGQTCVPHRHGRLVERPGLSTREKQVIGMVALGFSNGEIASQLFLAESTVKSHLSSAFQKLGVRSRHEAVELITHPSSGLAGGIMSLGAAPIDRFGEPDVE